MLGMSGGDRGGGEGSPEAGASIAAIAATHKTAGQEQTEGAAVAQGDGEGARQGGKAPPVASSSLQNTNLKANEGNSEALLGQVVSCCCISSERSVT